MSHVAEGGIQQKIMPVKIEVRQLDSAIGGDRMRLAQRVLQEQEFQPSFSRQILAFFDDDDPARVRCAFGKNNRGLFTPIKINGGMQFGRQTLERDGYPAYVLESLSDPKTSDLLSNDAPESILYDSLIYLYGSTCTDTVALMMTFAHELQHAVQLERFPSLWCDNDRLKNKLRSHKICKVYELPYERDARITAKRITERVCGIEQTDRYILQMMLNAESALETDEASDWRWVKELDSAMPYDLSSETKAACRKMRLAEESSLDYQAGMI